MILLNVISASNAVAANPSLAISRYIFETFPVAPKNNRKINAQYIIPELCLVLQEPLSLPVEPAVVCVFFGVFSADQ